METLTVQISRYRMDGAHVLAMPKDLLERYTVDVPRADCMEKRPDLGQYSPIVTTNAIERFLRKAGHFGPLPAGERWYYSPLN